MSTLFDDMYGSSMLMAPQQAMSMSRQMNGLRAMYAMQREGRMNSPRPIHQGRSNPFMPPDSSGPDYSQFTYDPQMRAQAESAGVHPLDPSQVNPNALLPNSGFFGQHPGVARGIEGAIFGAANTQGADTWGEGISNVARGILGGRAERQSMVNRQFQVPFENAGTIEKLRDEQAQRTLRDAMLRHYDAETNALNAKPDPDPHFSMANGYYGYWDRGAGQPIVKPIPGYQPKNERANEWEDFRDAPENQKFPMSQRVEKFKNLKDSQSSAANRGPWLSVPDGKGGNKLVRGYAGMPLPSGTKTPSQAGSTSDEAVADATFKQDLKNIDSPATRKQIRNDLFMKRLKSGSKDFSLPTESEITAEVQRRQKEMQDQRKNQSSPNQPSPSSTGGSKVLVEGTDF